MKVAKLKNLIVGVYLSVGLSMSAFDPVVAQEIACRAPVNVCAARDAVYIISSYDPVASAVRIGPNLLVTNRHVTADQSAVEITSKSGQKIKGEVVSTSYEGDLVLIKTKDLPAGPTLQRAKADEKSDLFTIGADFSRRKLRVYPPGKLLLNPSSNAPFPRLYHTALSQPGNSGGALVNQNGELVGIVTSGGEGRYEAFPVSALRILKSLSGTKHRERFNTIGVEIRACMDFQDNLPRRGRLSKQAGAQLKDICAHSHNRQLMDSAAVMLGKSRQLRGSKELLEKSLARDPQAINTRLSLITTLTFMRKHEEAMPHIRKLLPVIPEDGTLQRFAIQAGKFGGDMALAKQGLALVQKYNPAQAEAAARFIAAPLRKRPARKQKKN